METDPDKLYRLYRQALGWNSSPSILLPLIADHLRRTFPEIGKLRFDRGDDLKRLDPKYIPAAIAYLDRPEYQTSDGVAERVLRRIARKSA